MGVPLRPRPPLAGHGRVHGAQGQAAAHDAEEEREAGAVPEGAGDEAAGEAGDAEDLPLEQHLEGRGRPQEGPTDQAPGLAVEASA